MGNVNYQNYYNQHFASLSPYTYLANLKKLRYEIMKLFRSSRRQTLSYGTSAYWLITEWVESSRVCCNPPRARAVQLTYKAIIWYVNYSQKKLNLCYDCLTNIKIY